VSEEQTERAPGGAARATRIEEGILVVREGHGANCSSIGSVIDTLFATAVVGGAVLAAVAAALAREDVRVVGDRSPREPGATDEKSPDEEPPR
jgi:hypothetical protein